MNQNYPLYDFNEIDITNNDTKDVQISITTTFGDNQKWLSIPKTSFSVAAGKNLSIPNPSALIPP